MATYRKRVITALSDRMREKGATNEALARVAGVAPSTVATARQGNAVLVSIAGYIEEALEGREYRRDPRGAR
jgi:uncharacterized protein YbgA (DUF1722 family)